MLHLIVGGSMALIGIMGILTNLYIVVLLWNKKTRTSSEWILLHLSWCGIGGSVFHMCFLSPSIIRQEFYLDSTVSPFCDIFSSIFGSSLLALQLVSVWSVCALSADRAIAIVYPLRYSQIATSRRIAAFFIVVWVMSVGTMVTALLFSNFHEPQQTIHNHHLGPKTINTNNNNNNNMSSVLSLNLNNPYNNNNNNLNTINNNNNNNGGESDMLGGSSSSSSLSSSSLIPNPVNFNPSGFDYTYNETQDNRVVFTSDSIIINSSHSVGEDGSIRNKSSSRYIKDDNNNNYNNSISSNVNVSQDDGTVVGNLNRVFHVHGRELMFEFRPLLGICLPKVYELSLWSCLWPTEWILLVLIAPMCTLLVCDLAVLSIARRQSHRILLAMTMVTITAQATVTRSKGMAPAPPTALWANNVPARSRASRAVWEDLTTLFCLHLPLILILITEALTHNHFAPDFLLITGTLSLFATPSCNALLYGIRARPLRAAYKSYLRKRLTNTTLQNEIQNRSSPVDGSPRPSSRAKSYRSATPSPTSSQKSFFDEHQTRPRRLSTNDLRPPGSTQLVISSSPSHDHLGRSNKHNHHGGSPGHRNRPAYDEESNHSASRRVRSFLHIPSFPSINQLDMTEFWSGLRRPNMNKSPTIVITHEFGTKKETSNSNICITSEGDAEQRL